MSYTQSFAALAGAAVFTAQMANATPQEPETGFSGIDLNPPVEEVSSAQEAALGIFMLNALIPPEMKPLLQGAEITTTLSLGVNQDGNFDRLFTDLNIDNIDCTTLGAFYTLYGPDELDKKFMPPEDLAIADGVETLLADRHFSLSDSFSKSDLTAEDLEGTSIEELSLIPENVTLRLEASCSDYVAPPPSITPVEPK